MAYIRVLRGMNHFTKSLIFPAPIEKGMCVQEVAADKTTGEPATNAFAGIVIQNVTATGPDFASQNAGIPTDEIPVNHAATLRVGDGEIVTDMVVLAPTAGNLAGATVGNNLGIVGGKWRVAQSGDLVFGKLLEKDFGEVGRYRIQAFQTAVVTP